MIRGISLGLLLMRLIAFLRGDTISDRISSVGEITNDISKVRTRTRFNGSVPIIALTATATPEVYEDCVKLLHMQHPIKFQRVIELYSYKE